MAIMVDRWVAAGIAAVQWSGLADLEDPDAVADACGRLGFDLAEVWVLNNPEGYRQGLQDGFSTATPWSRDIKAHALEHAARVLGTQGARKERNGSRIRIVPAQPSWSAATD